MENKKKFILEFTIPRDLELVEGFQVKNNSLDFDITLSILKRKLKIPGINSKKTTATFVNGKDRFGDNIETRLKAEFVFNKNPLVLKFEELSSEEKVKVISNLEDLMMHNAIVLLNQIIETHQYVNDKYYIFPIEILNIYDFKLTTPLGIGFIGSQFTKGYFTNDSRILDSMLLENSKKVSNFINKKEKFFEPLRIMKYSIEFSQIGLLRPAITEAQSAVEHLLTKRYFELFEKEFPKKISKKGNKINFNFIEKLKEYSRVQDSFKFRNFEDKISLGEAKDLRNDIIHGKEVPQLNKKLCLDYLNVYKKLFNLILDS